MNSKAQNPYTTKLGWVSYWNLLPLKKEIQNKLPEQVEFTLGHPVEINKLTKSGTVVAAPCSSICLLKHSELYMPLPIGVAASKEVESVYIGFTRQDTALKEFIDYRVEQCQKLIKQALDKHPQDFRSAGKLAMKLIQSKKPSTNLTPPPLYFTAASETSVALSKLIWKFLFGTQAAKSTPDAHPEQNVAQLLIGDEALEKKHTFADRVDLATIWRRLTGLPFVFAVWQSHTKNPHPNMNTDFLAAAELAQAKMKIEPSNYFSTPLPHDSRGHTIDLAQYWQHLHYRLTRHDLNGLMLFLSLVCESQPQSYSLTNKLVSLQEHNCHLLT